MSATAREHAQRILAIAVVAALLMPTSAATARAVDEPLTAAHHRDWHDGGRGREDRGGNGRDQHDRGQDHSSSDDRDRGRDDDHGWGDGSAGERERWSALRAFAANNGGDGFWVLTKDGQVFGLEGAPQFPSVGSSAPLVAMAGHPKKEGLWLLDARGGVHAVGAARSRGSAKFRATGIAAHRSGAGYWVVSRRGKVTAFGSAKHHGDARKRTVRVDRIVARDDADGYYLHTARDRWLTYPRNGRGTPRPDANRPSRDKPDRDKPAEPVTSPPDTSGGVALATVNGITVARRIADNLRRMLAAAERDGVRLGGWGYRSTARQIELRRQHCGTTRYAIYEMPSSQCSPPTARPGHSMHEKGEAIDFYKRGSNGTAIAIGGTREFRWLKANAARYGFYNLPSEAWHWSTNGR